MAWSDGYCGDARGPRKTQPQQAADWRAVVRDDVKTEQQQPPWPFTCYAHQRGEANDMLGDFSDEEVSILKAIQPTSDALDYGDHLPTQPLSLAC